MSGENEVEEVLDTEATETEVTETEVTETEATEAVETEATDTNVSAEELQHRLAAANAQAKAERNKRQTAEQERQTLLDDLGIENPADLHSVIDQRYQENRRREELIQHQESIETGFVGKLEEAKGKYKAVDFNEAYNAVGTGLGGALGDQLGMEVANVIKQSDDPWGLIAKLHTDKDAMRQMTGAQNVAQAARIVGRLEASMASNRETNAPAPTNDLSGRSDGGYDLNDENLSQEQFEAAIRKRNGGSVFPRRA